MSTVLRVTGICKHFGGVQAIRDLSFDLRAGEILGLIGPNGSGKSTTVNVLTGALPLTSGAIELAGEQVQHLAEYDRAIRGLTRTFQTTSIFPEFTVSEHVHLGCEPMRQRGTAGDFATRIDEVLSLTGLSEIADETVGAISSAQQRLVMVASALVSRPKVILLDEPAAGMVAHERTALADLIRSIRDQGVAVLVIEHHMALIMQTCDRIVVLNFGAKIAEGVPSEIRQNREVIDAYLGEAA